MSEEKKHNRQKSKDFGRHYTQNYNFIELLRERSQELDNLLERHRAEMDRLIYGNGFYSEDPHGNIKRVHPQRVTIEERDGEITYFVDDFEADHLHVIDVGRAERQVAAVELLCDSLEARTRPTTVESGNNAVLNTVKRVRETLEGA